MLATYGGYTREGLMREDSRVLQIMLMVAYYKDAAGRGKG